MGEQIRQVVYAWRCLSVVEQERLQGFLGSLLRVKARLFIDAMVPQHIRRLHIAPCKGYPVGRHMPFPFS